MKISTKGRYGLRAMEVLTDNYGKDPVSIRTIAEEKGISVPYLEQLFTKMKKAGLVNSVRGAHGGYILAKPPGEISIGEVLDALEGQTKLNCCENGRPTCSTETEPCRTHNVLDIIEDGIDELTYGISLDNI